MPGVFRHSLVALLMVFMTEAGAPSVKPMTIDAILDPQIQAAEASANGSELRGFIEQYRADLGSLGRFYTIEMSARRRERLGRLHSEWLARLRSLDFRTLSFDGQVDYVLFRNHLTSRIRQYEIEAAALKPTEPLLPFASIVIELEEARRRMEPLNPERAAARVNELTKTIGETRKRIQGGLRAEKHVAERASALTRELRETLKRWYGFYSGYDPMFTWWVAEPNKAADRALGEFADFLRQELVGVRPDDRDAIVGNPIGREALLAELQAEMVPFTPDELIDVANREYAWCEREAKRAAREMGFGDDWKAALEKVKTLHVKPGEQTKLVRDLALEAIDFLEKRDLVTIPELAKESWRMEMMSPERQRVSPFFLGGEQIIVSFPTDTMTHEEKLMSMRANNIHFSRATVQHELIPGHHLQGFMQQRYKPYRSLFSTPFWTEGWALYWEMLLWDLGFPKTPEDRMGMLFWRMHRCARIIFSLSFHLGKMTPQECIDLLVDKVGHERASAEGEVRRSFGGQYGPLYQAAYMIGGLQFRALYKDLVGSGKMTNRQFHDAILKENNIPVEMVRVILTKQKLTAEYEPKTGKLGSSD